MRPIAPPPLFVPFSLSLLGYLGFMDQEHEFDSLQISPRAWLEELLHLFPGEDTQPAHFTLIPPEEIPQPCHELLVHDHHMTVTLENHHQAKVRLHALDVHHDHPSYARKLFLSSSNTPKEAPIPAVMAGIMRIWLNHVRPEVQEEILSASRPLGRILIDHGVLRRLKTIAFLKIQPQSELKKWFALPESTETVYGRLALIFCDGEPAVELLEIVPS